MMRRFNNMGTGGRGGGGGGGGGGPLMTNHLQDLELELELLKRKRQLIQQQQTEMLYRPNVGQMAYNPPRQMYEGQFDAPPRRDFSHLYEESPARPLAPKRRPVPVWDSAPGDRLSGPPVPNKRPRPGPFPSTRLMNNKPPLQPSRSGPMPSLLGPKPLMSFAQVPPKGQGPRPHTFQTKFKHNVKPPGPNKPKLTPKNPTPRKPTPNKPFSAPVAPKLEKESFILTADVKPRSKVMGRLEFALGTILKELKAAYNDTEEHKALFVTMSLARVIKQTIRERLRTVMLGKLVGSGPEVVAEYRKAYPPSTDADIVKLVEVEKADQEKRGRMVIELFEEGDPELYFKKNVTKLLEVKFDEMFQKIEKSYENASEQSEIVENLPDVQKEATEETFKVDAPETPDNNATKKHPKEEDYDKWISLLLERKLPQLLRKHKQDIIKVLDLDESFRATKAAIIMNANNKSLHIAKTEHNVSKVPETSTDDPVLSQNLPYYAKVLASPLMPNRKLMNEFLRQFKPKTIKRHKKNFNLLFVGFNNKDYYESILKADKTIIGTATITILGNSPKTDQGVIEIKDDDSEALDQVLTPQLDDQINDLLSSIRKADEEASDGTNGEAKTEDVATENGTEQKQTDGNDSDVQEVNADADVVAIEDDEAAMETDGVAPLASEAAKESDVVGNLTSEAAEPAPATPAKAKTPATPSTIRTRRASRLAQNN